MAQAIAVAFEWIALKIAGVLVTTVGVKAAVIIGTIIAGATLAAAGNALFGRLTRLPDLSLGQQGAAILDNSPSNSAPIPVIYGSRRVGGTRTFIGTSHGFNTDDSIAEGEKNSFLNIERGKLKRGFE